MPKIRVLIAIPTLDCLRQQTGAKRKRGLLQSDRKRLNARSGKLVRTDQTGIEKSDNRGRGEVRKHRRHRQQIQHHPIRLVDNI